jgi:hypothetical protein
MNAAPLAAAVQIYHKVGTRKVQISNSKIAAFRPKAQKGQASLRAYYN